MIEENKTSSRVTADLVSKLAIASTGIRQLPGFTPFMLVPDGFAMQELHPEYLDPLPDHIRQCVQITELESFIAYVKKFKTHTAQIFAFANDRGAKFGAVLDYHEGGDETKPGRARHRVNYEPEYSPEFNAWLQVNAKALTQEQFLDHIRKWGDAIKSHTDADLIELASSLDFTVAGEYSSHVERVTGGRKLLIQEKVEGSGSMKNKNVTVPDSLRIKVPVFVGGREYDIGVDVLYRPQGGTLRIIVELRRVHLVIRQAVKDIVTDVKEGTEIEPFLGSANCE